jgi:hypothetical protein
MHAHAYAPGRASVLRYTYIACLVVLSIVCGARSMHDGGDKFLVFLMF